MFTENILMNQEQVPQQLSWDSANNIEMKYMIILLKFTRNLLLKGNDQMGMSSSETERICKVPSKKAITKFVEFSNHCLDEGHKIYNLLSL